MLIDTEVLVADECWIALASLHRESPERTSFTAKEIMDKLRAERICGELRTGLQPHIYLHNVANIEPNSAKYRMFYRLEDGTLRLFKPGDLAHPARKGKTCPKRLDLPERYHHLLDWYEKEYCAQSSPRSATPSRDFVLEMRGVGKDIWSEGGGDAVVESLRSQWELDGDTVEERVWNRVVAFQGEEFRIKTGESFTHSVTGNHGIWFYRNGEKVNKLLWRGQLKKAVERCLRHPPGKVTVFRDLIDSSYIYGLLTDPRIRDSDW